jgi:uncharacterized protein (DUF488 family)
MKTAQVLTIGYTRKSLERFLNLLREAKVDAVIDVRLRNTSQLAAFAKRDDLAYILSECAGIAYEHHMELAPTPEILSTFRSNEDWSEYVDSFQHLMRKRDMAAVGQELLARYTRPCLLCSEPAPDRCHRSLVAELWANVVPGLEVVHLI